MKSRKKILSLILCAALIIATLPGIALAEGEIIDSDYAPENDIIPASEYLETIETDMSHYENTDNSVGIMSTSFKPRLTAPSKDSKYYYSDNPFYKSGYGMPNCTAYAYGRAYEILGKKPKLSTGNAGKWYNYNKSNGYYNYGQTPKLGAVACWDKGDSNQGHVAVVEEISGNNVVISESHYQGVNFDTRTIKKDSSNYLTSGSWRFLGYIYIGDFTTETKPATPKISSHSDDNVNSVTLGWNAVSDANKYTVQYRKAGQDWNTDGKEKSTTSTSIEITGLEEGKLYWFRIKASNAAGESGYSENYGVYMKPKAPTTVTNSTNSITINWAGSGGQTEYELLYRKSGDPDYTSLKKGINETTYTHNGLEPGTLYYYKVKAYNKEVTSVVSGRSEAGYGYTKSAPPTLVSKSATSVTFSWPPFNGNGSYKYYIYRDTTCIGETSQTSYTDTTAYPNTTYSYYFSVERTGSVLDQYVTQIVTWADALVVQTDEMLPDGITLNTDNLSLVVGNTAELWANVTPDNAANKSVSWSSSNEGVALVSSGLVTAVSSGTAVITASTFNGITASCTVTVNPAFVSVTDVVLNNTSAELEIGETLTLTATVLPANATNKAVSWTTSGGAATVSNDGTVTARSAGTAIITATTADGGHMAKCTVTVTNGETPTPPPTEYTADIVVDTVIGQAGKEVTVPVRIVNNPGIAALNIQINYDKTKLTPVTIELGSALGVGTVTSNIQQGGDMNRFDFVTAYWDNPANVTGNGDLVNVTFKVAEGLEDQLIPVTVSYNSGGIINQNYETVDFNLIGGGVKLTGVKMGDIYSDGEVDSKDGLKLRQYLAKWDVELSDTERAAADVFHDGDITSKDGLKLRQYLAKWDVSLEEAALMAAGDGRIKFEVGTVSADGEGYADVPVSITENTGVAVFNVQLDFDRSLLTPVSIEGNGVYGGITSNIQQSVDPGSFDFVTAYWDNPSNVTDTGTAFTVRFKVAEGFSGSAPVKLTYYENDLPCDQSFNELAVEAVDGAVNAGGSEELYTVNSLDVEKVGASLRVKAGVTKNGERSGEDAIVIAMYKDGALVDMLFMEAEFAQGQTARFGGMMDAVDGATVKAFVWDDLTTMAALSNTVEK